MTHMEIMPPPKKPLNNGLGLEKARFVKGGLFHEEYLGINSLSPWRKIKNVPPLSKKIPFRGQTG